MSPDFVLGTLYFFQVFACRSFPICLWPDCLSLLDALAFCETVKAAAAASMMESHATWHEAQAGRRATMHGRAHDPRGTPDLFGSDIDDDGRPTRAKVEMRLRRHRFGRISQVAKSLTGQRQKSQGPARRADQTEATLRIPAINPTEHGWHLVRPPPPSPIQPPTIIQSSAAQEASEKHTHTPVYRIPTVARAQTVPSTRNGRRSADTGDGPAATAAVPPPRTFAQPRQHQCQP